LDDNLDQDEETITKMQSQTYNKEITIIDNHQGNLIVDIDAPAFV